MFKKLSFAHLLGAVLALSFIVGFAVFVLSGATTNKGTTGAIGAESATIMTAEKTSCTQVRHVRVDIDAAKRGTAHVQAGLQLGGVRAREALRDDRHRLPGLPIAGWLKEPHSRHRATSTGCVRRHPSVRSSSPLEQRSDGRFANQHWFRTLFTHLVGIKVMTCFDQSIRRHSRLRPLPAPATRRGHVSERGTSVVQEALIRQTRRRGRAGPGRRPRRRRGWCRPGIGPIDRHHVPRCVEHRAGVRLHDAELRSDRQWREQRHVQLRRLGSARRGDRRRCRLRIERHRKLTRRLCPVRVS